MQTKSCFWPANSQKTGSSGDMNTRWDKARAVNQSRLAAGSVRVRYAQIPLLALRAFQDVWGFEKPRSPATGMRVGAGATSDALD